MAKCIGLRVYLAGVVALAAVACGDESTVECRSTADCLASHTDLGSCQYVRCDTTSHSCKVGTHPDYHQCQDNHPCTQNDYCLSGACLAGSPPDCDDGIDCTEDHCDEQAGCSHVADDSLCDDGEECTDDFCDPLHGCGYAVNQDIPGCQVCSTDLDCDDQETCTGDFCDLELGLCQSTPLPDGSECSDGDPCTAPDTCQAGVCQAGADICNPEICDNQADDDGDDLQDCMDPDCQGDPACRVCEDDGLEDNDETASAVSLSPGHYYRLVACPQDPDHYSLALDAGDSLEVTLYFSQAEGDLDLAILDSGGEVLVESQSQDDGEFVSWEAQASGVLYVRVDLVQDRGEVPGNDYHMSLLVENAPPVCNDDGFEDNDGSGSAVAVSAGEFADLHSCPGDPDYFAFSAAAGDQINLAVTFSNPEGDIDLQLLDPLGQVVASSNTTSDNETLAHTASRAGTYQARVWLDTDAGSQGGNDYTLHLAVEQAPPTCADDGFEDNDEFDQAVSVAPGTHVNLRVCPGDGDYFGIWAGVGDQILVDLAFAHAQGDIQLQLLEPGGWLVAESSSVSDDESLTYTVNTSGRHVLLVWLNNDTGDQEGNSYGMSIVVEQAVPTCADDEFEDNDEPAQAVQLAPGSVAGLRTCPGDEDYFRVAMGVGDQLTVDLRFSSAEGNIDLQLFDPDGLMAASSTSATDDELARFTAQKAGDHLARVWLVQDAGDQEGCDYSISVTLEEAPPTCAEDDFEDNDSQAGAAALTAGTYADLRSCPGDQDFYAVDLGVGDQIDVSITFVDAEGDIDLQFLDPGGAVVASSLSLSDDESVSYTATASGTWAIRVWLHADAGAEPGNAYDMTVTVEEAPLTCPDDSFEDNDSFYTAALVSAGLYQDLRSCSQDEDFYLTTLVAGEQLVVDLVFLQAEGDIDLQLLDIFGTVVASSISTSDDESIDYTVGLMGFYTIRVVLYQDGGSSSGNDYQMNLQIQGP